MDIDLDDVDPPTTKEKGKRVSTEIFDEHRDLIGVLEEYSDHNSEVLSALSGNQSSGSQSSLPKKRDSTEIFDKFIAVLEEDSDHNSELWSAFTGSRFSLPKKGDLVVYFPQGHLEYESPPYDLLLPAGHPTKEEVRTYELQPQIICRVEHVQLMIKEADDDEICAKITLHPEPEVNSEEKELEQSDEIEDYICEEDGRPDPISTPTLFSKIFLLSDILMLLIPHKAAIEFFCLDKESMDLQNEVTAKDLHGNEWKFRLIRDENNGYWLVGGSEFVRARNVQEGDRVVFLREKDTKLIRFGIRRGFPIFGDYSARNDDPLSEAAGAILKKSIFSVMFRQRGDHEDCVIPYQKYMKSITRPGFIGAKVHKQYRNCSTRFTGVVTGMADLDPKNWPNSKWKCLLVKWEQSSAEFRVSPWEIVFDDSPSPFTFDSSPKPKRLRTSQQDNSPPMPYLDKHNYLLSNETVRLEKQKHVQAPGSIHCEADTTDHPFDIKKQTSAPQTSSSQLTLFSDLGSLTSISESKSTTNYKESKISNCSVDDIEKQTSALQTSSSQPGLFSDLGSLTSFSESKSTTKYKESKISNCSVDDIEKQTPAPQTSSSQLTLYPDLRSFTSFSESKSTTNFKELKISNCSVDDLWIHLKGYHSHENLEFDSCSFPSSTRLPIPITVTKLKITNCVDTEQVFTVLMDPNLSVKSLEIDSCSSFSSMSTGGIPATLRQLKIVNCMNLKSLSKSFKTKKSSSIGERVHYSTAGTLQLRKLEIQNCVELEFLPKGLHKLRNLDILSINNCSSIEYFPEGGLPRTCLTSLSISECENLKCLPNKLHKVTSLQKLSISGCPSLMVFPEGGLPSNLVSLHIIDCENLISLSQWELHKLKHLRKYSFSCGY